MGVLKNLLFAEIKGLSFNMNFETSYGETSLILLIAGTCKIYEVPITSQNELE